MLVCGRSRIGYTRDIDKSYSDGKEQTKRGSMSSYMFLHNDKGPAVLTCELLVFCFCCCWKSAAGPWWLALLIGQHPPRSNSKTAF